MPALLPSQMAAYLNAAAHAAQSHRLMLTSPLITSTSSPPPAPDGILDFSRKRPEGAPSTPLDLSVGSRKRAADALLPQPPPRKAKPSAPCWPYPPPSGASKALEKMSQLSKIGGEDLLRMASGSSSNRNSAWQSHWLSKGADQAKDVLKCVWCKQSFASLAALTAHMKEAKHCGVNVSVPQPQPQPQLQPPPKSPQQAELNMLIKETMPLPRKLVRGQDVWLGKGAEQTRQILKCMWCGQSFRSLAEMTSHMQQTQHYTNIISQEQIISWRSSDDKGGAGASASANHPAAPGAHVSAVLTCKVCDQAFASLKELSNHMVKNAHYKEHIMRSLTESGGRRRQTREKRKKSLPVRKLLELERAHGGDPALDKPAGAARITCEKCAHKIDTGAFVDHIRQCVGGPPLPPKPPTPPSPAPPAPPANGSSPSVLNAIEKLIEKSFDSRARPAGAPPAAGSSILKRLGIDESVDYTKPLVDAQTMSLLRSYQQQRRERSGSESSSLSERGSSRVDSLTLERPPSGTPRSTPEMKPVKEEAEDKEATPAPSPGSPSSERSATPAQSEGGSLGALSSMFDSLSGAASAPEAQRGSSHPLAALQKLCDKTETSRAPPASVASAPSTSAAPGAILAFSWACNDAVGAPDAGVKCAFCDTPCGSKGAYRHHLSKVHFVKEGVVPEPPAPGGEGAGAPPAPKTPPPAAGLEESPHSKFLKYTELAKQLSSKYV